MFCFMHLNYKKQLQKKTNCNHDLQDLMILFQLKLQLIIFLSGSELIAQAGRKMNKTQLDMPRISNENLNISLYTDI